jgi:hypothetical protein
MVEDPDPDPGGPKTRGSGGSGSGSATLIINVFTFRMSKGRRRAGRERTGSVFMLLWRSDSLSTHSGQDAIQGCGSALI